MKELITERLIIIPCSLDMALSLIYHRKELETKSPIAIPKSWPSNKMKSYLPFYIEKLAHDQSELGWGIWIIIEQSKRKIIGCVSFKGKPDINGAVELAYDIVEHYQGRGYGYEAAQKLVEWAFTQEKVKKIIAECHVANEASIRILNKLGMTCLHKDGNFLYWELRKE